MTIVRWEDKGYWSHGYDANDRRIADAGQSGQLHIGGKELTYATKDAAIRAANSWHSTETITTEGKKPMLNEVTQDAKKFISDNRTVIYWIALIFLADYFFFNGAFRTKLNALVEKMIGRAEKALDKE